MPKFRKRPIVVEAEQWFPGRQIDGVIERLGPLPFGVIQTLEEPHIVEPGDWIITGIAGEKYPCKPDIFAATYEPAQEDQAPGAACPDCGADLPPDGLCFYCETMPEPLKEEHEETT